MLAPHSSRLAAFPRERLQSWVGLGFLCATLICASGCTALGVTLLGLGASAGISHQMNGVNYRTFTEPLPRVKKAAMIALRRMAINVDSTKRMAGGEVIKATAAERSIEIEFEALTPNTTRMRSVARKDGGVIMDSATAVEIIVQTEKALGNARS